MEEARLGALQRRLVKGEAFIGVTRAVRPSPVALGNTPASSGPLGRRTWLGLSLATLCGMKG